MASNKKTLLTRNKEEWDELCKWIELNLFEYDPKQKLQKNACLTLEGLRKGQATANNKHSTYGEYPINIILMTFKLYKNHILNALNGKNFESEDRKMKYICAIVRDKLNGVYSRYLNSQKSQEKIEKIDTSIMDYQGAEYQSNTKSNEKKDKFKELW